MGLLTYLGIGIVPMCILLRGRHVALTRDFPADWPPETAKRLHDFRARQRNFGPIHSAFLSVVIMWPVWPIAVLMTSGMTWREGLTGQWSRSRWTSPSSPPDRPPLSY